MTLSYQLDDSNRNSDIEKLFKDDSNLLVSLETYLLNVENDMNSWLAKFEWSKEVLFAKHKTKGPDPHENTCPFNKSHTRIKASNLINHVNRCRLRSLGYTELDILNHYKQSNVSSSYQIDLSEQARANETVEIKYDTHSEYKKLVKLTTLNHEHYFSDLNRHERLALHEYALKQFEVKGFKVKTNEESFLNFTGFNKSEKESGSKIFDDLRDKKRRPKSYKTCKSTSYKDNIRQLIETQMELIQNMNEEVMEKKFRRTRSPEHDSNKHKRRSHSKELGPAGHSASKHSHSDHHKHKKHKRSEHKS